MPPEDAKTSDTRAWLRRSSEDLRAANVDMTASPPLVEDALFHCQQAAEKALKAFLAWHDRPFRKTHDLVELGAACCEVDNTLEPILKLAAPLTEFAWRYRYPWQDIPPAMEEGHASLDLARQVYQAIAERLGQGIISPNYP
ncbi:MAG: HEPN domain-containing protein [Desulfarculus sp.]|nr:HEPN domain-containing protein [Desulfarculus sp.]